jgi:type IV secretory pathway VirB6-like protein
MRGVSIYRVIPLLLIMVLVLCSCEQRVECIDPDDWGGRLKTRVTSEGSNTNTKTLEEDSTGKVIRDAILWTKGYELDGKMVTLVVKNNMATAATGCNGPTAFTLENTWIPIMGKTYDNPNSLSFCEFIPKGQATYAWCPMNSDMGRDDLPILNPPCRLRYGLGLYATISKTVPEPGEFVCKINPDSTKNCLMHIGDALGDGIQNSPYMNQVCPAVGLSFIPPPCPGDCVKQPMSIYLKIIDRYYRDNLGGYTIEFIQGVRKAGGGAITKFVGMVQLLLCNVSRNIYNGLVKPPSNFIPYIRAILLLYIILLGFSSAMGFSSLSHKDLLIRVLKIGLITQLISPTSWEFFNTHFFKLFTDGIGVIISIIFGQSEDIIPVNVNVPWIPESSCNFQTLSGFSVFDRIFSELFSRETTRKVLSLLVWRAYGFLYIAVIYICLGFVLFTVVKCILLYLISFLIISILIVLAPIFISFILFDFTRSFFEKWLETIISYFVQPIIILTFAFFVLQVFQSQLQSMLGYRVCWKPWGPTIPVIRMSFYAWQADYNADVACIKTPNAILSYDTNTISPDGKPRRSPILREPKRGEQLKLAGSLNIETYPGTKYCNSASEPGNGSLCTPYNCSQQRHIGYPYLNQFFPPDTPRINELAVGTLVSFRTLMVFVLIVWFLYQFSKSVPDIAKLVAKGTLMGGTDLKSVGSGMVGGMGWAAGLVGRTTYWGATLGRRSLKDDMRVVRQSFKGLKQSLKEKVQDTTASGLIELHKRGVILSKAFRESKAPNNKLLAGAYWLGRGAHAAAVSAYDVAKGIATAEDTSPHNIFGKKLEEFGQATFGRARTIDARKAISNLKINGETVGKRVEALKDRIGDRLYGTKGLEKISDTAQEALDKADAAIARGDAANAIQAYEEAARAGSTKALISLGDMYARGEGIEPDIDESARLSKALILNEEALQKGDESAREEIKKLNRSLERLYEAQKKNAGGGASNNQNDD